MYFWTGWSLAHRDWHHIGAAGWVFWNSGDIVICGEFGSVVVGVQEMNDDVCGSTESLWGINFHCEQLKRRKARNKVCFKHFIFKLRFFRGQPCTWENDVSHSPWLQSLLLRLSLEPHWGRSEERPAASFPVRSASGWTWRSPPARTLYASLDVSSMSHHHWKRM